MGNARLIRPICRNNHHPITDVADDLPWRLGGQPTFFTELPLDPGHLASLEFVENQELNTAVNLGIQLYARIKSTDKNIKNHNAITEIGPRPRHLKH